MNGEFLAEILAEDHVDGLDDLSFSMTQNSHGTHAIPSEVLGTIDVDVQSIRSTKVGKRQKNFHWEEDVVVCSGWLNATKDPILGANQTRSTFWGRVTAYFEKNKTTTAVRTESSIMHRWLTIQHQVNKFHACYDAIERRNQSGCTAQDMITDALKMYSRIEDKKGFTLIPCWNILKKEDKWAAKRVEIAEMEKVALQKKKKNKKTSRPREEEEAINNGEAMVGADQESPRNEARKRPEGVKKAKEALKRGAGDACMEALDKMWAKKEAFDMGKEKMKDERFLASLEIEKANLELEKKRVANDEERTANERKRAEAELLREHKEIMLVDKRSLDPLQLRWIELMQQDIMSKLPPN